MNVQLVKRIGVALALALLAAGSDRVRSAGPGLGTSTAAPVGAAFSLPDGLVLERPIKSYASEDPIECDNKFRDQANVGGAGATLCLVFNNTTDRPIVLTLPPGLLFVSKRGDVQNGLLAQRYSIEVPARERYFAPVFLYCANQSRDTGGVGNDYELGPIIEYPAFRELYDYLEGKTLVWRNTAAIQSAVTRLTNGEALRASDRAALGAM